jgi:signal transduction histidine kinase
VYRWFDVVGVPRYEGERLAGYTGCYFDITDRKLSEEAAIHAAHQKDEFLAILGHELRNPLAAATNAASLLEIVGTDEKDGERALEILRRQLHQLGHLTDDLSEVGRLVTDQRTLIKEPVDLGDAVSLVVQTLEMSAKAQTPIDVSSESAWIEADPARIQQIIGNLLDNALKFTPPHGHIKVRVKKDGNRAKFTVTDSGIGIPKEFMPRIFEPFSQAQSVFSAKSRGLGLGLALVKRLVEMHGREITAESEGPSRRELHCVLPTCRRACPADKSCFGSEWKSQANNCD